MADDRDQYRTGDGNREYLGEGEKKLKEILKYLGEDDDVTPAEYEEFVMALTGNNGFPDKETVAAVDDKVKAVLNIGLKDGEMTDEVINVTTKTIPVTDLIPTQSQIGLLDSIGFIAFVLNPDKQKVTIPTYTNGRPNLGGGKIVTANGKYIIDGHHRWSGVYMINPEAQIDTFDLDMSKFKDQERMLATVQLAVASTYGAIYMKNANAASDIFNYGGGMKDLVYKVLTGGFGLPKGAKSYENCSTFIQILAGVSNEELDLSAVGKSDDECKEIIIAKLEEYPEVLEMLAKNAEGILAKKPADAPKRVAMPQPKDTAEKTGGSATDMPAEIEDKLKSGELNFLEPMTTENTKWIKTYDQFRNKK